MVCKVLFRTRRDTVRSTSRMRAFLGIDCGILKEVGHFLVYRDAMLAKCLLGTRDACRLWYIHIMNWELIETGSNHIYS